MTSPKLLPLEKPVLIVGERGTGKELIAARLHYLSNRWDAEFIKMNCAAISDSLLESELFGHESGAFTGATRNHRGRFERADGGTLFLDELATTSKLVQEKILRVIEYGEFERVGGNKTIRTSVRLVAATNEDLPTLADEGVFRRDLLDRLAFDVITLPPLRHRPDDITLLAEHFAINMATELGQTLFPGFTDRARETLLQHDWPGNVRELKNVVERCVYRNPDPTQTGRHDHARSVRIAVPPTTRRNNRRNAEHSQWRRSTARHEGYGPGIRDRPAQSCTRRGPLQPTPRSGTVGADLPPAARLPEKIQPAEDR